MSVDARPRSTTSSPSDVTPAVKAAPNAMPLGRMSVPTTTRVVSGSSLRTNRANARPMASASGSSSSSGTRPRTSYALNTALTADAANGPGVGGPPSGAG